MENDVSLELYIPEPRFRPGDKPDFSYLNLPAAGTAPRPDTHASADETRDLAYDFLTRLNQLNFHAIFTLRKGP